MIRALLVSGLLAPCLLAAVGVTGAAAGTGKLIQKPRDAGCLSVIGFCTPAIALDGAVEITVSPDGKSAYVASRDSNAVVAFDRARDGTLIQKKGPAACLSENGAGRCRDGTALVSPTSVAVSPDGKSAYVASQFSHAVAVFDRRRNGKLIQKPGTAGCVSDTGAGSCVDGTALDQAESVTVSPDGQSVYVTSLSEQRGSGVRPRFGRQLASEAGPVSLRIGRWGRPLCGRGGPRRRRVGHGKPGRRERLRRVQQHSRARQQRRGGGIRPRRRRNPDPEARPRRLHLGDRYPAARTGPPSTAPRSVTISPDGHNAYVASKFSDAVAVFDRRRNGKLVQKSGASGCISGSGAGTCVDGTALSFPESVALSPDGESAYVPTFISDAVAVFNRAANGTLAQKRGTAGCIREGSGGGRCTGGAGLDAAASVAVSPDGQNAYIASTISDAVALFDREPSRSRRRTR